MNRNILKDIIYEHYILGTGKLFTRALANNENITNELIKATEYLEENTPINDRWYYIKHNLYNKITCKNGYQVRESRWKYQKKKTNKRII